MPASARGSVYALKGGLWGIRWQEDGHRQHKSPFRTKTEARDWFNENVKPRLRRAAPSADITYDAFCDLFLERWGPTVAARSRRSVEERLRASRAAFGSWKLSELEGAAADVARWRAGLTDTRRYLLTGAFRQVLAAAVRWRYITANPAVEAGANPEPRAEELHPFTRDEIERLAVELGPVYGPLCIFAAETGLRTNEWAAVERRDIDRTGRNPAVVVQRRFSDGVLTPYPKTGRRRVPLSDRALGALEALPRRLDTQLLFPAPLGGYVLLGSWRGREFYPALEAAGIDQRGPYHLRHTFATEALQAGMSIFLLARLMGTSVKIIDQTYGHLAHDSEDSILDALNRRGRHEQGEANG